MSAAPLLLLAALCRAEAGLDALWADLASDDDGLAARAVLGFAAKGKAATGFLARKLRPVKADAKEVAAWLKRLDSDDFEERREAAESLAYQGKAIRPALEKALRDKPSPEVKRSVQGILERLAKTEPPRPVEAPRMIGNISMTTRNGKTTLLINGKKVDLTPRVIVKPGPLPAWRRAARASALLEHLGTPEARKLLEKLAGGDPEALPTRAAKEALARMAK